ARRSLLVLDNLETVLAAAERQGVYRVGYEGYGRLLRLIAETAHPSCLLLTSREAPPELAPFGGVPAAERVLELGGLGVVEAQALLARKALAGDDAAWARLVGRYGGNPLALQVVGETIRQVFGGEIAEFLDAPPAGGGGGGFGGGGGRRQEGEAGRAPAGEREAPRVRDA